MQYNIVFPSPALSGIVKFYWAIEHKTAPGVKYVHRIIPNGLPELTFHAGDLPKSSNSGHNIQHNITINGQISKAYDLEISGHLSLFSVVFYPYGISKILGIPASEYYNQCVPLEYLLKDKAMQLNNCFLYTYNTNEKVKLVDDFLIGQLKKQQAVDMHRRIQGCINKINLTGGQNNINELADYACLSRKQFERTFFCNVGITPKRFLKTVRFQYAIYLKSVNKNCNLTELAYACGYYDQAHMTNDFQQLSGLSPKAFFNYCEPVSDYFM